MATLSDEQIERIRDILKEDVNARPVFQTLAKRERHKTVTDLFKLRFEVRENTGVEINDVEMLKLWDRMQSAGFGKVTPKRRPQNSTFTWKFSAEEVARAGATLSVTKVTSKAPSRPVGATLAGGGTPGTKTVVVTLRGQALPLELPHDFNHGDLDALTAMLRAVAK